MWRLTLGKYREIIFSIALFLVLDAGVLLLNFYTSYQIEDDAHGIQLAAGQHGLLQRIFHSVHQVKDDLQSGRDMTVHNTALANAYKQFDEVIDSFIYGGELIGQGAGKKDSLPTDDVYQKLSERHLLEAEKLWKPYRPLIAPFVYAEYQDDVSPVELIDKADRAIAYANANGDRLLEALQQFTIAVEAKAQLKARRLRMIQAIGITLALINFFIILFHFIKNLSRSDERVDKAQKETAEILRTVNDGLFLLDHKCKLGSQYSASMNVLFKRENFAGEDFIEVLKPVVSDKTLDIAKDYIEVLFNKRVKSSLMEELNPLQDVEISLNEGERFSNHVFSFDFNRVYDGDEIIHLLVTVTDITEMVKLRNLLHKADERIAQEVELLLSVVHLDANLVSQFVDTLRAGIRQINGELERSSNNAKSFKVKSQRIGRIVHGLKGESAAIGLMVIEEKLNRMEDTLADINMKKVVEGNDFLPVTVELNHLINTAGSIESVLIRLNQNDEQQKNTVSTAPMALLLEQLVTTVSTDMDKSVRLDLAQFNADAIPPAAKDIVKDALIQLVRNSIAHGLEKKEERVKYGKPEEGTIRIRVLKDGHFAVVEVRDDGRGINLHGIRQRLIQSGKYSALDAAKMPGRELIGHLFRPGFSTAKAAGRHAGRGVGLDLVKTSLDNIQANLSVSYKAKQFTEFRIRIPMTEKVVTPA